MSVIRQQGRFNTYTRRRLVGVTAAIGVAALETVAVAVWFVLAVVEPRTLSAALAGLGVLFCGALLRMVIFGTTATPVHALLTPRRVGASLTLVAAWPLWVLTAETVGGPTGMLVAGFLLSVVLMGQFVLERRVFRLSETRQCYRRAALSALVIGTGATVVLWATWFSDWSLVTDTVPVGHLAVYVQIEAYHLGFVLFGALAFLVHQHRFYLNLEP